MSPSPAAIAPGGILTPGVGELDEDPGGRGNHRPAGPARRPDEIGRVTLFLASEPSSCMLGEQIVVDGGRLLR